MVDILLIRHGETKWNREEIFRGQTDIPLNDQGREQAKALGKSLLKWNLTDPRFLASPLARAYETAQLAASFISPGSEIVKAEAFKDICFGDWEGKTLPEVERKYPELYRQWKKEPGSVNFPGGESLDQVAHRTESALYRIARSHRRKTVVIVSHRAVNKTLLCRLLGLSSNAFWKLQQHSTCVNELQFTGSDFILIRLNDTCHLETLNKDATGF